MMRVDQEWNLYNGIVGVAVAAVAAFSVFHVGWPGLFCLLALLWVKSFGKKGEE